MKLLHLSLCAAGLVVAGVAAPAPSNPVAQSNADSRRQPAQLPLFFEANRGQVDPRVRFLARTPAGTLFLTDLEAVLALRATARPTPRGMPPAATQSPRPAALGDIQAEVGEGAREVVVRMRLVGANGKAPGVGLEPFSGKVNYFLGQSQRRWQRNVPAYRKVRYSKVYPGVDLVYHGNQRQLEYDFVVAPGADPGRIRLAYGGVRGARLDARGDLVLSTEAGELRQPRPEVYQDIGGVRRAVDAAYRLSRGRSNASAPTVSFRIGAYDRSRSLVIDPLLVASTLFGGGMDDVARGLAVDRLGYPYIAGFTTSRDLPGAGLRSPQVPESNSPYVFVAKFNPEGTQLLYASILGGLNQGIYGDQAHGVAVDPDGNAWVGGQTDSRDFPTTATAVQPVYPGSPPPGQPIEGFLTKLNADGSQILYSTYFGGGGGGGGVGGTAAVLAVTTGLGGRVYITGGTDAWNDPATPTDEGIPVKNAPQPELVLDNGADDAFVASFDPNGLLIYSTYLGGNFNDTGLGITVGATGVAYVMGQTFGHAVPPFQPKPFPTTPGALQTEYAGDGDLFVTTVAALGGLFYYSTYLGGTGNDGSVFGPNYPGGGIAVDPEGNVYVTGTTLSDDFPTTAGALQPNLAGSWDAFVTKIRPDARLPREQQLKYSTYLGGGTGFAVDQGKSITVDPLLNAYVTGFSFSPDFPLVNPLDNGGSPDGSTFLSVLNPAGSGLLLSTRLGANGDGEGQGVALGVFGDVYVGGNATPTQPWPTTDGAFQDEFQGGYDSFVMRVRPSQSELRVTSCQVSPAAVRARGGKVNIQAKVASSNRIASVTARVTLVDNATQSVTLRKQGRAYKGTFRAPANTTGEAQVYLVTIVVQDRAGGQAYANCGTFTVAAS